MDSDQRGAIADELNAILCSLIDLRLSVQQAHWNVKGINFQQFHELFDKLQERLLPHIDLVAENITTLGGITKGTTDEVSECSILGAYLNSTDQYEILESSSRLTLICNK